MAAKAKPKTKAEKLVSTRAPSEGTHVIWPPGCERRYGIDAVTRWRWEKSGKLPPRDVNIGGKTGWRPETLATAEQGVA